MRSPDGAVVRGHLTGLLMRLRALVALAALVIVFSALSPDFLTAGNLEILIKHVAINAILAVGMTFVVLSGGIDLSVGSIVGLAIALLAVSYMTQRFVLSRDRS